VLLHQFLGALDQDRQHDERAVGNEGREERVAGDAGHLAIAERRHRGHHQRQNPEGQQQSGRREGDKVNLQAGECLRLHGAGRNRANREHAIGREVDDKTRDADDGPVPGAQGRE